MPTSKSAPVPADLLLELFSEEIPARMQARAAEDLLKLVVDGLKAQGLPVVAAQSYATPRRLALTVCSLKPIRVRTKARAMERTWFLSINSRKFWSECI